MNLPENLISLYEKNTALLEAINFNPETDDPLSLCNIDSYLATNLLDSSIVETMFSGTPADEKEVKNKVARNIGMVLVRPDMTHANKTFETFLKNRFKILHSADIEITGTTYWEIYKHDFYRPETMHCRLSRAALYVGSMCRLYVFEGRGKTAGDVPVADIVFQKLKGKQGIFRPRTLRGDIVYRNALELGLHELDKAADERLKIAVDPFRAYRELVTQASGDHTKLQYPLLFYTGVGVHVPNATEIQTDLPALLEL